MMSRLVDFFFGCRHQNLGIWYRRAGSDWQDCLDCGSPRLAKVQTGPDKYIKAPIRTQEAKAVQPEEEIPTGLERRWLKDMGVSG